MWLLAWTACATGLMLPETNKKPTREKYEDFFDNIGESKKKLDVEKEVRETFAEDKVIRRYGSTGDTV